MTDSRSSGLPGQEQDAAAQENRKGDCRADCGCRGDRPPRPARTSRASSGTGADGSPHRGIPEPRRSMMAALGGGPDAFASCCAPFADADTASPANEAATTSADCGQ